MASGGHWPGTGGWILTDMTAVSEDATADLKRRIAELEERLASALTERDAALERQKAAAEILGTISDGTIDAERSLTQIAETTMRLFGAPSVTIRIAEGDEWIKTIRVGPSSQRSGAQSGSQSAAPGANLPATVYQENRQIHIPDMDNLDPSMAAWPLAATRDAGARTVSGTPLRHKSKAIGALIVYRDRLAPFTPEELALQQTFADQAVIAIENARLFNETQEALARQTATSDILRIINQSPTNEQPVFDAIVGTAVHLLGCDRAFIIRSDGITFSPVAGANADGRPVELAAPNQPIDPAANFPSRAIAAKEMLHIADWSSIELPEHEHIIRAQFGVNAALYLPLLRGDDCIGLLALIGGRPNMFGEKEMALAESFRDQAVIAIENVRLFDEVQARTRKLSKSLDDLRAAQDRLIQTEKLASLGQLTAGIAHEIKNPLNFVNNFAALSAELTDELKDALKPAVLNETIRAEVDELTGLLKDNLGKVVQHGKRADSIVKNMLLHSREGSGERRPADVNALVEESLNLAYHGARAEKPQFNVTLKRDFDPEAGTIEVFPQEITRVLLNLISNGFYAVAKRKAEDGDAGFEPVVSATTKGQADHVEIRIRDNGTGIPPDVKEKMFDPFFTTKPAGEGTGLGLSMSHDIIVKQHGGTIDVDTLPGTFTEFTIVLPRTSQFSDPSKLILPDDHMDRRHGRFR